MQINLMGAVAFIRAAIPHMRTRRGRFITVSSGAAEKAYQGWSAYCW
jgi:NAD(P)-dependent dehydrogenase (short-subunit alcohol dehydrogenase family)